MLVAFAPACSIHHALLVAPCCCHVVVYSALPVTARSLEALIRLSQAHAKLHLADRVEAIDVQAASR
jgi:hypothetical protein